MSELPDSDRPQSRENKPEGASPPRLREIRVNNASFTEYRYGRRGELLSVVRMIPRDESADRKKSFRYRGPDAA